MGECRHHGGNHAYAVEQYMQDGPALLISGILTQLLHNTTPGQAGTRVGFTRNLEHQARELRSKIGNGGYLTGLSAATKLGAACNRQASLRLRKEEHGGVLDKVERLDLRARRGYGVGCSIVTGGEPFVYFAFVFCFLFLFCTRSYNSNKQ